jgi:hypothetical protein
VGAGELPAGAEGEPLIRRLLAPGIVAPLWLDLYISVPEENRITAKKIELGRRLSFDRRLSSICARLSPFRHIHNGYIHSEAE